MNSRFMLRCFRHSVFARNSSLSLSLIEAASPTKSQHSPSTKEKSEKSKEMPRESKDQAATLPTATNQVLLDKTYSEKIHRIVDEISQLSMGEILDLNELLKKVENEEFQPVSEPLFKVRLVEFDQSKKLLVINKVKDVIENINLIQAKRLVESTPMVLCDNLTRADAERVKAKMEAVGGACVIE